MAKILFFVVFLFLNSKVHADTVTGAADAFSGPNVYSPSVLYDNQEGDYKMWYGGWQVATQNQDHIYYRASGDGVNWPSGYIEVLTPEFVSQRYQELTGRAIALTHVNDPSVTKHFNQASGTYQYTMFFTACNTPCEADGQNGVPNHIWSVVSADGVNWDFPQPLNPPLPSGVYGDTTPSAIFDDSDPNNPNWQVYFGVSSSQGLDNAYLVYVNGNRIPAGSAFSVFNYNGAGLVANPHVMTVGSTWYLIFNTSNNYAGFDIYYSTSSTNSWYGASPLVANDGNPFCATIAPAGLALSNTQYFLYFGDVVGEVSNGNYICNFSHNQTISIRAFSQ